ncbi:MAG: D-alanyl-D-alanine carboxypeptidase family protein [Methylophaga sp.]|jgi:D-alanyl-D-alanine carboxypeptidase (penicillin-binding protein 5/6)|uniref:D-alanyl-D-alanine carboxypeptidase family protein n=1 Tax=unclassified Methylophaga TaxID=2629249 RepID=UPI000C96C1A1|nr:MULTISPECIES: D-alanyl-D-alanine carboxypeptidase family protein [unclassified Methylophaga]MAP26167.1 serine-type D-Ala-D-Ala carboxypeptidase [Methylophaga sp.]MDX1750360.1 D-alanyl-D-alanine carboxypeptidase family protein [Methylophaga sp.]HAD32832.1 serine-type D-Ala-D-Ala carboxypeptidase [Methylophaga sp.]HCO01048.1 serine-type D-Ala-D-Ala carboxypeptidase [Methylophaga sp.]|tara:strand:+ start:18613 stop:19761 length:1149 start_codon:yes stop_codon:yes gene_type:complete
MIKIFKMSLAGLLFSVATISSAGMITPNPTAPSIAGTAHILQDYDSGHILMSENADERLPPASITKLMTSYVVSQEIHDGNIKLDDEVLISEKAWRMIGSRSFIEVNTKVTVEALLRGMIVQSGNDAAVALAEHVAGSEEVFAQMMNQYAQKLGMVNTNYQNATGLPGPEHYTTAHDIAILSAALIRDFPEHYQWYAEKEYTYNGITQHNRNKLLWRDNTVDGLKTGHTEEAGYCLSASAKRDGMRLIAVVLGTASENARAQEIQKMFNFGFRFFETHQLYAADEAITQTKVWKGQTDQLNLGLAQPLSITVPRGRYKDLQASTNIQQPVVAPVAKGTELGEVEIRLGDEVVATRKLVAVEEVEKGSWWRRILDSLLMLIWG